MPDAFPDHGEIRFRRHRDFGDVLNGIVAMIRGNARELATSFFAVVAPVALATGIATGLFFHRMGGLMGDMMMGGAPTMDEEQAVGFGITYFGILLFSFLGTALTTAAAAAYVRLYREGLAGEITASRLWEDARGLILPFIGLQLLYGLVVGLSLVIVIVPCLGILAWLAFIGWSLPYYAVTVAARTLDEPTLAGAWQRSRLLVKGSWGPAFGAIAMAGLLFYLLVMVASLPLYVVMGVAGVGTATDPSAMFTTMGALFAPLQVVTYAGYLIPLLAIFFVHGRLAEELDGTGLSADLDALAGEDELVTPLASSPAPGRPAPTSTPPAPAPPSLDDLDGPPDAPDDAPDGEPDGPADPAPGGFRGGGFRS